MKKTVIIQIVGGLGNQMFQYSAGLALAEKLNAELVLDITHFQKYKLHSFGLKNYGIEHKLISNRLELFFCLVKKMMFTKKSYYRESGLNYSPFFDQIFHSVYLKGYFQSEKYFYSVRDSLLKAFALKEENLSQYTLSILAEMKNEKCLISLHVRRGDYLLAKNQSVHGLCDLDYYKRAMNHFQELNLTPRFVIFSDDIAWTKENLGLDDTHFFIDGNGVDRNYEDIFLMSNCHHHIMANSSFSWWGAWLNPAADKIVIAPKNWFSNETLSAEDIYGHKWKRL